MSIYDEIDELGDAMGFTRTNYVDPWLRKKDAKTQYRARPRPYQSPTDLQRATSRANMTAYHASNPHRGSGNPRATISAETLEAVVEEINAKRMPHRAIAAKFGISHSTVTVLAAGRHWSQRL